MKLLLVNLMILFTKPRPKRVAIRRNVHKYANHEVDGQSKRYLTISISLFMKQILMCFCFISRRTIHCGMQLPPMAPKIGSRLLIV